MSEAEKTSKPEGPSRVRIVGARVLTVVAILLALVGMIAFYVKHTALDKDGFEAISRQMIENDEIRTQVAAKSVDTLFANVDAEAAIAERLPPDLKGLAPVLAGVAQSGADDAAVAVLERPRANQTASAATASATSHIQSATARRMFVIDCAVSSWLFSMIAIFPEDSGSLSATLPMTATWSPSSITIGRRSSTTAPPSVWMKVVSSSSRRTS